MEIINFRLTARARRPWPAEEPVAAVRDDLPPASGHRQVVFSESGPTDAAIIQRDQLLPGHAVVGPAVIEQLDTTTLVYPGDRAVVDKGRNLIIEISHSASASGSEAA